MAAAEKEAALVRCALCWRTSCSAYSVISSPAHLRVRVREELGLGFGLGLGLGLGFGLWLGLRPGEGGGA